MSADPETVSFGDTMHPAGLAPGRYVRLAVTDTGAGMDTATVARACEPFFTTKHSGLGTGLGLPMVKGFAEQSGGGLTFGSSPGAGTTVTIWLPVADLHAAALPRVAEADAPGSSVPLTPARLMVVDDEELIRDVLAEQLQDASFGVLSAASGAEALALLAAGEAVDAIITDLSMPAKNGIAVIAAAQARCPGLPAVLLTGYAGDDVSLAVGGAVTGAFSLLRKPSRIDDLVDRVQALLAAAANRSG